MRRLGVVAAALLLAACVGEPTASLTPTPTATSALSVWDELGPITLAAPSRYAEILRPELDEWNAAHPAEPATLRELPDSPDVVLADLQARAEQDDGEYTLTLLDAEWLAALDGAYQAFPAAADADADADADVDAEATPAAVGSGLGVAFAADPTVRFKHAEPVKGCAKPAGPLCAARGLASDIALARALRETASSPLPGTGAVLALEAGLDQLRHDFQAMPAAALTWDDAAVADAFTAGEVFAAEIPASYYQRVRADDVTGEPASPNAVLAVMELAVSAHGRNLGTASALANWLTRPEAAQARWDTYGLCPPTGVADLKQTDWQQTMAAVLETATVQTTSDKWPQAVKAIADQTRPVLLRELTPAQAAQDLQAALTQICGPASC
ncbi:MAG: hypothetical protein LBR58_11490 [Propionibacteriaceae bacterium]|jgi:multiple sugar transport system substrate-binding protein|nr:hypothetical protein [Propionibacteriaceae bacterium]